MERKTVSPVAQRGGTATVGTSALHSLPRLLPDDMGRLSPRASVDLPHHGYHGQYHLSKHDSFLSDQPSGSPVAITFHLLIYEMVSDA